MKKNNIYIDWVPKQTKGEASKILKDFLKYRNDRTIHRSCCNSGMLIIMKILEDFSLQEATFVSIAKMHPIFFEKKRNLTRYSHIFCIYE